MTNIVLFITCGIIFTLFGTVLSGNGSSALEADPDMPHLEACSDTSDDEGSMIQGAWALKMKGPNGKTHRVRGEDGFIWITPNGPSLLFTKDDDGPPRAEHIYMLKTSGIRVRSETAMKVNFDCNEGDGCWIEFKTPQAKKNFLSYLHTPPTPPPSQPSHPSQPTQPSQPSQSTQYSPPSDEPFQCPSWISDPSLNPWYPNFPPNFFR